MAERLSPADASMLTLERPATPMHAGGLGLFDSGLTFAAVHDTMRARLDAVPRARQRVATVALPLHRPVWVDDEHFDLSYHLRHAALPAPGDRDQLAEFLARLMARPLDRSRPLWEVYVIQGVGEGRTGVFRKVHLAMAGGEEGDPFSVLLDEDAGAPSVTELGTLADRWQPEPAPGAAGLVIDAVRDRARDMVRVGRGVRELAWTPRRALGLAGAAAESTLSVMARMARSRPDCPLNLPLSPHRRFATARVGLDGLRAVRRAFGGTINDAVVSVVGDAVGRLLRWRGHETKDLDLRVMVPVRVHDAGATPAPVNGIGVTQTLGEGAVGVLAPLPIMEMDPVARLYRVMGELAHLKESRQAVAAETLLTVAGYGPPNLHALAARLASAEQRYNLALSNAPGPRTARHLAGTRMEEAYPFIPLAGDAALSVAVTGYLGEMFFGLLGERDAMKDLDLLAECIVDSADDLRAAAEAA